MHGLIFAELEKFVTRAHGVGSWERVLAAAKMQPQVYVAIASYPDVELLKLVQAASVVLGMPGSQILEGFGEFVAPTLLDMYRRLIDPQWRTLDLLEHTERVIHTVVRGRGGTPPVLSAVRESPRRLVVDYASQRRLCALARGIIRGLASRYAETVTISESSCMLSGGKSCRLEVTVLSP